LIDSEMCRFADVKMCGCEDVWVCEFENGNWLTFG